MKNNRQQNIIILIAILLLSYLVIDLIFDISRTPEEKEKLRSLNEISLYEPDTPEQKQAIQKHLDKYYPMQTAEPEPKDSTAPALMQDTSTRTNGCILEIPDYKKLNWKKIDRQKAP